MASSIKCQCETALACVQYVHLGNLTCFLELLQVRAVPTSIGKCCGRILQAGCPSYHPTNSIKALKDDIVPDWGHHAAKVSEEHCDGSVGCLAIRLQGSIPPATITEILTGREQTAIILSREAATPL